MPKVSVIIPNYNHAPYLQQRIQSVLDQTFQDFDLIYLDDASTDNSNAVFAEFEPHQRIIAIYNYRNSGSPFKQWNKGVRATEGEYIWIAESDDVAHPDFLANLVPILDCNPHVGLVYSQSCQIDRNNVVIAETLRYWAEDLSPDRWNRDFITGGMTECQKYLIFKNTIPNASAVLIRRSIYEVIGGAEESLFLTGDWMTWIRMLLRSDMAFCAQVLNSFRTHRSSVSSQSILNGTQTYESLLIRQTLEQFAVIPPEIIAKIKEELIGDWIGLIFNSKSTIDFEDSLKFYQLAKKTGLDTESMFIKQFIYKSTKKIKNSIPSSISRIWHDNRKLEKSI
jgi:glycosyltransferase involved in cell wall biosynthesis